VGGFEVLRKKVRLEKILCLLFAPSKNKSGDFVKKHFLHSFVALKKANNNNNNNRER